ncbi:MAG: sensor histidine kinase, partial [Clostridia bacterium]|nr:sensor histidine kinase [Clostridia bacterium]
DDGNGIDAKKLEQLLPTGNDASEEIKKGKSIGLKNIDQRLRLSYGAAYALRVESEVNRFTRITLRLPADRSKRGG